MISSFLFSERSPNAPGSAASSAAVTNAASYLAAGVAGPLDDSDGASFVATLQGATGGPLDVYLQVATDAGPWVDAVHFAQLAAGAAAITLRGSLSRYPAAGAPVAVGMNATPGLAANTIVQGLGFNRARLFMVAGAGTTAGAPLSLWLTPQRSRKGR